MPASTIARDTMIGNEPPQQQDNVDDVFSSASASALLLAIISLVIYLLFLRPTHNNQATPTTATATTTTTATRATPRTRPARTQNNNNNNNRTAWNPPPTRARRTPLSEAAAELLWTCRHKPVHVSTSLDQVGLGGNHVLQDGLVAFGHSHASSSVVDNTSNSRKERAQILTQLLSKTTTSTSSSTTSTMIPPPVKGSTVVVAIPPNHSHSSSSSSLGNVLYVLATYYNLIVLWHVDTADEATRATQTLRSIHPRLTLQVLPSHRCLATSSMTGRIAVSRQLGNPQVVGLVVDWQTNVQTQLQRFGYSVVVVEDWNTIQFGSLVSSSS